MARDRSDGNSRDALFGVFRLFGSQVERLVLLNALFAAQFLPLLIAIAVPLPLVLRVALIVYTSLASVLAIGALYAVLAHIFDQELISPGLVWDVIQAIWRDAYMSLMPLVLLLSLHAYVALQIADGLLAVLLQVGLWALLVSANYWGPLFAQQPHLAAWEIAREALRLAWRHPVETLLLSGTSLLVTVIGLMSIAGLFLAIPVIIAMLQTAMFYRILGTLDI